MGCRAQGVHTVGCRRDRTIHLTQRHEDFCFTKDSSGKGCTLEENNSCFQSRIEEEVEVMDVYYSSLKLCNSHWKEARLCFWNLHLSAKIIFSFFSYFFFLIFCPHRLNTSHHKAFLAAAVLLSLSIWKANSVTLFSLTEFTSNANDGRPGFCFPCCQGGRGDSGCDKSLWRSKVNLLKVSQIYMLVPDVFQLFFT